MRLVSWNVQWCRGVDGRVDPARIAAELARLDADVACLQEIASGFPELPGSDGEDQPVALWKDLPQHEPIVAWGVDVPAHDGARMRFGNMLLTRLPPGRIVRHALPWPEAPEVPTMPRVAVETVVEAPFGPVRVVTTHLEYYSAHHRAAQVRRLAEIVEEGEARRKAVDEPGPYRSLPKPVGTVVCGDFNFPPDDPLHAQLVAAGLVDAWQALHPGAPHPPTFRLHERKQGVAPYCCDFVFVSRSLAPRLAAIAVDGDCQASDHQPVSVELQ